MSRPYRIPLLVLGLALGGLPTNAHAQRWLETFEDAVSYTAAHVDVIPRMGMAWMLTPAYCGGVSGWHAGVEARTRGRFHLGLSYDMAYSFDSECVQQGGEATTWNGYDATRIVEDDFDHGMYERIALWAGTDLEVGNTPMAVALGFGHAHEPWWRVGNRVLQGSDDAGAAAWWLGAQADALLGSVLRVSAEIGALRTPSWDAVYMYDWERRMFVDHSETQHRWRPTLSWSAGIAGGTRPVRPDHGGLVLSARTGSFNTGVATHGCTVGDPGSLKGMEARTTGTVFGAISVDLARVGGGGTCQIVRDSLHDPNAPPQVYVGYNGQTLAWSPRLGLHLGVTSPPYPVRVAARIGGGVVAPSAWTSGDLHGWTAGSLEAVFFEYLTVGYERGWMQPSLWPNFIEGTVNALMGGARVDDWVTTERYWIGLQVGLARGPGG